MDDLNLNFITEEGVICENDIVMYALSTCGFCKKAIHFLKENSIKFSYIYFDDLDSITREKIEKHILETFNDRLVFPLLVINCKKTLFGFNEQDWTKELL